MMTASPQLNQWIDLTKFIPVPDLNGSNRHHHHNDNNDTITIHYQPKLFIIKNVDPITGLNILSIYPCIIQFVNDQYQPLPVQPIHLLTTEYTDSNNTIQYRPSVISQQIQCLLTAILYKEYYTSRVEFESITIVPIRHKLTNKQYIAQTNRIQQYMLDNELIDRNTTLPDIHTDMYTRYFGVYIRNQNMNTI